MSRFQLWKGCPETLACLVQARVTRGGHYSRPNSDGPYVHGQTGTHRCLDVWIVLWSCRTLLSPIQVGSESRGGAEGPPFLSTSQITVERKNVQVVKFWFPHLGAQSLQVVRFWFPFPSWL